MTASIDSPSEGRFQFVAKFKEFSQKKKRLSLRQLLMFCLALDGGNFSSEFSSYFVTFLPHKQAHMHTEKLLSMLVCVPIQIQIQQLANPHDNAHIFMHYSLLFGVGLEPFASVLGSRRPQAGGIRHTRNVASAHMHKYFCVYSLRDPRIEGM